MNRVKRTIFFADATGYARHIAVLFDLRSLFLVVAVDNDLLAIRHISNNCLWTSLDTLAASSAFFRVHNCQTVSRDVYGIKWTNSFASAIAQTSKSTGFPAAGYHSRSAAIRNALVFESRAAFIIAAFADDMGDFFDAGLCVDAHYLSECRSAVCAANRASIDRCVAGSYCDGKLITAWKSTAATVRTRKRFPDQD